MSDNLIPTEDQLHHFINDLEESLKYEFGKKIDCEDIILCGMGGSAISGDVVSDCYLTRSMKPITVIKSPVLPKWANERTLVVLSSYSGNTIEVLEAYRQAIDRGCIRVLITAGGLLSELAEENEEDLIKLPQRMHPRHSIGFMIGYTLALMKAAGCGDVSEYILNAIPSLKRYRTKLENKETGPAMKLARYYIDRVPVICSYSNIQSIILRWKTQFNENSKYVAFCTSIPEFKYSDLKGWIQTHNRRYALTLIVDDSKTLYDDSNVASLIMFLRQNNVDYNLVSLGGDGWADNMFRALMLGDYLSIYMAELQGIDASTVPPITRLKEKLSDFSKERNGQ